MLRRPRQLQKCQQCPGRQRAHNVPYASPHTMEGQRHPSAFSKVVGKGRRGRQMPHRVRNGHYPDPNQKQGVHWRHTHDQRTQGGNSQAPGQQQTPVAPHDINHHSTRQGDQPGGQFAGRQYAGRTHTVQSKCGLNLRKSNSKTLQDPVERGVPGRKAREHVPGSRNRPLPAFGCCLTSCHILTWPGDRNPRSPLFGLGAYSHRVE